LQIENTGTPVRDTLIVGGIVVVGILGAEAIPLISGAKKAKDAADKLDEIANNRGPSARQDWEVPQNVRDKLPENWGNGVANKKGEGVRFQDPDNPGNGVRVDRGNPDHSLPSQKVDHVVVRYGGRVLGRDGNPISGTIKENATQAHIPLSEYQTWSTWFSP